MTPRPRRRGNKDLPPNLYRSKQGYFTYRHPLAGTKHGMGTDRAEACRAAKMLNARLTQETNLVHKVMGGYTINDVIRRFREEYLVERNHADRTRSEVDYRLRRYERELGEHPWDWLTLERLSNWLRPLTREAYRKHRSQLVEIFRFAVSVGVADENTAEKTLPKAPQDRVRKRWTLEQFSAAREQAAPWLRIAMDLALVTLQRREDLVNMRYDDIEDGRLLVRQSKNKDHRLAIRVGTRLSAVIADAKAQGIHCPYIIARIPERRQRKDMSPKAHPFAVVPSYLTKAVAAARDATGLFNRYEDGERPTLHEIRSLGAHLYREAGFEEGYIQALLGHENARMTEHYLDGHKVEWTEVGADLPL